MIEAVILDFGGVILNIDFDIAHESFATLGVKDFREMYSQQHADHLFRHFEEGRLTDREFYEAFRRTTQLHLPDSDIRQAWNSMLLDYRRTTLDTLKKYHSTYRLYLLSNTNSIHLDGFMKIFDEQIGGGTLDGYFDKTYYSHLTGRRKPATEAYQQVLEENGLDPSRTLFIDDTFKNLAPAEELGMQTIWLQKGMFIEELDTFKRLKV